jgi:hypothetical protein
MKKLLLTAAMLAIPAFASAQTVSGSVAVSATIPTTLDFGAATDINFGTVTANNTATAAKTGSIAFTRNVGVSFYLPDGTATGRLYRGGVTTAASLQPTWSSCGVGTTATTVSSSFSSCTPASGTTSVLTLAAPTTGATSEFVIFTGTLTAPSTTQGGTYTGSITIQAVAN